MHGYYKLCIPTKGGARRIAIACILIYNNRFYPNDSNGTANRCIDNALLRYGLLVKLIAMRLIAWPYRNIKEEQMYKHVVKYR